MTCHSLELVDIFISDSSQIPKSARISFNCPVLVCGMWYLGIFSLWFWLLVKNLGPLANLKSSNWLCLVYIWSNLGGWHRFGRFKIYLVVGSLLLSWHFSTIPFQLPCPCLHLSSASSLILWWLGMVVSLLSRRHVSINLFQKSHQCIHLSSSASLIVSQLGLGCYATRDVH